MGLLSKPPFFYFDEELKSSIDIAERFRKMFREESEQEKKGLLFGEIQPPSHIEEIRQKDLEVYKSSTIYEGFMDGHCQSIIDGKPLPTVEQLQLQEHRDIAVICWNTDSISRAQDRKLFTPKATGPFLQYGIAVILYFRRVDDEVQLVSYYAWENFQLFLFPNDN